MSAISELAATEGKSFAVIADVKPPHSSQAGEAAAKLKTILSAQEIKELEEGVALRTKDLLVAQMAARSNQTGISYIAFTATPKAKTLELFDGKPINEVEVERSEALKGLMRWVKLHAHNIAQKVQIVLEHFRENVAPLIDGQAKAMVVVASRLEAVRWKLAIDKYIKEQGYGIGTLVAFSGEIKDQESGIEPFSESSKILNPRLKGRDIRQAFDNEDYQILI
jgi:type I restriction enzyme R subunit